MTMAGSNIFREEIPGRKGLNIFQPTKKTKKNSVVLFKLIVIFDRQLKTK